VETEIKGIRSIDFNRIMCGTLIVACIELSEIEFDMEV